MPEMVSLERFFCRSGPWRLWTRRYALPWALQGEKPAGKTLEVGTEVGSTTWSSGIRHWGRPCAFSKPGGSLVGYDILDNRTFQVLHKLERARVRVMTMGELSQTLDRLAIDRPTLTPSRGNWLVRFKVRKRGRASPLR